MKIIICILSMFVYMAPVFGRNSLALNVVIKNVVVPQNQIVLDSFSNGRYYYSGKVTFDFESVLDSANLHVYLEEVPFQRYLIPSISLTNYGNADLCNGAARFCCIDSLCTGDVGQIKPKKDCLAYWRYSTVNRKNHCRIKLGIGNYLYANTKSQVSRNGDQFYNEEYDYNNLGLVAQARRKVLTADPVFIDETKTPKYTRCGQVAVDDTIDPFILNVYNDLGQAIFKQKAQSQGLMIVYVLGYLYDSMSRAIQIQHLNWGATAENPGVPFSIESFTYNKMNRVVQFSSNSRYEVTTCEPYYEFEGNETMRYYYKDDPSELVDSLVREFRENARNNKLVSRIVNINSYRPDGFIVESVSLSKGFDDPGTCWGTQVFQEQKVVYFYDSLGHQYGYNFYERRSPDSTFVFNPALSHCNRREYDTRGNTLQQFDFCDQNEVLVFKAQYNEFNHIVRMEGGEATSLSTISTFTWDLIDLDKQEEFLQEHEND